MQIKLNSKLYIQSVYNFLNFLSVSISKNKMPIIFGLCQLLAFTLKIITSILAVKGSLNVHYILNV